MVKKSSVVVAFLTSLFSLSAFADRSLVRFEGGIGVIPVSRVAGDQNADGSFPNAVRNDVRGTPPGGQPWVIERLSADVRVNGFIRVDGRGLLLAGGNNVGLNGNQSVRARLFCGNDAFDSANLVPLEANGDFRIDDSLSPQPPDPCVNPVLLIINPNGAWFAAGIPKP